MFSHHTGEYHCCIGKEREEAGGVGEAIKLYRQNLEGRSPFVFSLPHFISLSVSHLAIRKSSCVNINVSIYIVYLQDDQLGVVIEDSRWELLYLVVLQISE